MPSQCLNIKLQLTWADLTSYKAAGKVGRMEVLRKWCQPYIVENERQVSLRLLNVVREFEKADTAARKASSDWNF